MRLQVVMPIAIAAVVLFAFSVVSQDFDEEFGLWPST